MLKAQPAPTHNNNNNNNNRESHWIFYRLLWLLDSKPGDTPGWRLRNKQLERTERYPIHRLVCVWIPWLITSLVIKQSLEMLCIERWDRLFIKICLHQFGLAHTLILCHKISFEIETYRQIQPQHQLFPSRRLEWVSAKVDVLVLSSEKLDLKRLGA